MATVVNVLFGQISVVFIRVVEIKPRPILTGEISCYQWQEQRSNIN